MSKLTLNKRNIVLDYVFKEACRTHGRATEYRFTQVCMDDNCKRANEHVMFDGQFFYKSFTHMGIVSKPKLEEGEYITS